MWWRATWAGPSPTCSHQPRGSTRARQPARTSPTASHIRKLKRWLDKNLHNSSSNHTYFSLSSGYKPIQLRQLNFWQAAPTKWTQTRNSGQRFYQTTTTLMIQILRYQLFNNKNITSTQPLTFFRTAKADNRRKLALLQWWRAWANRVLLSYNKP